MFRSHTLNRAALIAAVVAIVVVGIILAEVVAGWRPQNIIAAAPTPDLTATAVVVEPRVRDAVQRGDSLVMQSQACACDNGLAAAFAGSALAEELQRVGKLSMLIRRRTTVVHQWRVESVTLATPIRAQAVLYRNLSQFLYQGLVPVRRTDGAYLDHISLTYSLGVWKINRIRTSILSRSVTATPNAPAASYQTAYILDDSTGRTLYSDGADVERFPASTTKMMTALVALQHLSLNAVVTVPAAAEVGGTTAGLVPGERLRVRDLFYGMLLPSGNDAATTLALATSGSIPAFAALMNAEAARLHLTHTHFLTPHGLDVSGQYSTAHDLAWIAHSVLQQPFLAGVVRTRAYHAVSVGGGAVHSWTNLNHLLGAYPGAIGVKTGTTAGAGANLAASAVHGSHRIIAVLLGDGTASRYYDATRLLNYGWRLLGINA
jgi:hypothetical protein